MDTTLLDFGAWSPVVKGLVVLILMGLAALLGVGAVYIKRMSRETWQRTVLAEALEFMHSVVAHVQAHLRPDIEAAMADGKFTTAEAADLKSKALKYFKDGIGESGMRRLEKALPAGSAIGTYISGLIERSLGIQKALGTLPTVVPVKALPAGTPVLPTAAEVMVAARPQMPR